MSITELLRLCLSGTMHAPGDAGYERACRPWNLALHQRPAYVVNAHNAEDVVAAVRFACARGLPVGVMCTGVALPQPCDGGVLINTAAMRGVRVDPRTATAWVEAGARWQDVVVAAQPYGLAPATGTEPHLGAVGDILGGATGWLHRAYGTAADSVLAAQVVLADGEPVVADPLSHDELFWAIRGGGGNFGAVTGMRLQLVPMPQVYGGGVYYPIRRTAEVFGAYRRWLATAPAEITSSITLAAFPADAPVPAPLRGRSVVGLRACYPGTSADGARLTAGLRLPDPLLDTFADLPYPRLGEIAMERAAPAPFDSYETLLTELPDMELFEPDVLDAGRYDIGRADRRPACPRLEIRHLGANRKCAGAAAGFGSWDAEFALRSHCVAPNADSLDWARRWHRTLAARVEPLLGEMSTVDPPRAGDPVQLRRRYRRADYRRLAGVKGLYDPSDVFRFCHAIDLDTFAAR